MHVGLLKKFSSVKNHGKKKSREDYTDFLGFFNELFQLL